MSGFSSSSASGGGGGPDKGLEMLTNSIAINRGRRASILPVRYRNSYDYSTIAGNLDYSKEKIVIESDNVAESYNDTKSDNVNKSQRVTKSKNGAKRVFNKNTVAINTSRSGVDTSANFFEFWILCFILCLIDGIDPSFEIVDEMMDFVYWQMKNSDINSIDYKGVEIFFPNIEKIDKYMVDWNKKKTNDEILFFLNSWTAKLLDDLRDNPPITLLFVGCHPPIVVTNLEDLNDNKGKNATPDVTIVFADDSILGYSAKQNETNSKSISIGNHSIMSLFYDIEDEDEDEDEDEPSFKLLKSIDLVVKEYKSKNPKKQKKYAREYFEILDKTIQLNSDGSVTFSTNSPFEIIQKVFDDEYYQQKIIDNLLTTLHQQLYPGIVKCVGLDNCIENINNVVPYTEHAKLWTHSELYKINKHGMLNAAKMYYLLFSPFYNKVDETHEWICYKLEIGRRGDTNYKTIATILCRGNICNPLICDGLGINAQEFIHRSIENYKTKMNEPPTNINVCEGGGNSSSAGGGSDARGGGGWKSGGKELGGGSRRHKRKTLKKRKTRRRK